MGIKITLGRAREEGDDTLLLYCASAYGRNGCHHRSEMGLLHAIALWGTDVRLDDLPFYCSKCGSRKVNVRSYHYVNPGGGPATDVQ